MEKAFYFRYLWPKDDKKRAASVGKVLAMQVWEPGFDSPRTHMGNLGVVVHAVVPAGGDRWVLGAGWIDRFIKLMSSKLSGRFCLKN